MLVPGRLSVQVLQCVRYRTTVTSSVITIPVEESNHRRIVSRLYFHDYARGINTVRIRCADDKVGFVPARVRVWMILVRERQLSRLDKANRG